MKHNTGNHYSTGWNPARTWTLGKTLGYGFALLAMLALVFVAASVL